MVLIQNTEFKYVCTILCIKPKNHSAAACSVLCAINCSRSNTRLCGSAHMSWTTSAANKAASLHTPQDMASSLRPWWLQSPRPRRTQQTGRARRLHDVNKHSSILPSKRLSHCCGQRCLTCVMSDEMAGNVLAVFDAHWCFSWPLRGLGKGVCAQPHCWTSIDQSQVSKQFGDAASEVFSLQNNGDAAIYLRDFKVVLGLLWHKDTQCEYFYLFPVEIWEHYQVLEIANKQ